MLQTIHQSIFYMHIIAGGFALVVFWLPIFSKKGNKNHKRFGRLFVNSMYLVSISGFLMTSMVLLDPIGVRAPERNLSIEDAYSLAYQNRVFAGFLFMLSFLVFNSVRQSILVLKAKADRSLLKIPSHIGLLCFQVITGLVMGWIGLNQQILLFEIFAVLVLVTAIGSIRYIFKAKIKQREWIIVHLGNILGAGIGAYTAFFAFGGSRLFAEFLSGSLQVIPWVLPGVIGTIGSIYLARKYRQKFKVV